VTINLLRDRNFGLLWWASLVSISGDWALRIVLPLDVLKLTGAPAAVSGIVLAELLASLLLGTVAGAYVDRWDRRRVVVVINVLQALVLLPLLAVHAADRIWIVVLVAFAESALAQFFVPAENALLPRLVAPGRLAEANSWSSVGNFIGRLVGPALGGVTVALGLSGAAVLDAITFLLAAMLCAMIVGSHRATVEAPRHLRRELAEGLRALAGNRITRAIVVFLTVTAVGEGMMSTLFSVYVVRAVHAGGREMSWMLSAQAIGGILGGLIGARVADRFRPVALASICFAAFGLIDLAIFNYPRWGTALWPVVAMFFLVGVPAGVGYAAMMTLFQEQTPDRLRGRVFAVLGVCQAVAGMVGAAVAGGLGQSVRVIDLLTVQGAGYVLAAILMRVLAGRGPEAIIARGGSTGRIASPGEGRDRIRTA
jgi:MFS family permease